MSGLLSLTATAPTDALRICPSVTGAHVSPPSVVFHSPPPVAPKYASFGRPRTPLTAMERPPRSGPIERQRYDLSSVVSTAVRAPAAGAAPWYEAAGAASRRMRSAAVPSGKPQRTGKSVMAGSLESGVCASAPVRILRGGMRVGKRAWSLPTRDD